mmetsp:Transcript_13704/g.47794  ORF Transcript_13704/g.47794 Transcript_13704/m.47794 type:complete len:247 (+) Transcript_13704:373-1113(+)
MRSSSSMASLRRSTSSSSCSTMSCNNDDSGGCTSSWTATSSAVSRGHNFTSTISRASRRRPADTNAAATPMTAGAHSWISTSSRMTAAMHRRTAAPPISMRLTAGSLRSSGTRACPGGKLNFCISSPSRRARTWLVPRPRTPRSQSPMMGCNCVNSAPRAARTTSPRGPRSCSDTRIDTASGRGGSARDSSPHNWRMHTCATGASMLARARTASMSRLPASTRASSLPVAAPPCAASSTRCAARKR